MRPVLLFIGLGTLLACSGDRDHHRREIAEISERHDRELARFEEAKAEFARRNPVPAQLDFPGDGTILIHECEFQGYPGREEFRLLYTYVNTTGHVIDEARITLTLPGPDPDTQESREVRLKLPLGFRFNPDSSYTTHLQVPTHGSHLRPSWEWKIRPKAVIHNYGA